MKLFLIIAAALLAILIIVIVVLGAVDLPAPSGQVEKVIPADRLIH